MTRFLRLVLCALCSLCGSTHAATRPNIIFLLADDMGYGDFACYGHPVIKSPNLDELARDGVRLTDCYAASPNCSPARTGILAGRSPYRVGIMDFIKPSELGNFTLYDLKNDPSETTNLAESQREQLESMRKRMIQLHTEISEEGPRYELRSSRKKK